MHFGFRPLGVVPTRINFITIISKLILIKRSDPTRERDTNLNESKMNDWVKDQITQFRQLVGQTVVRWTGIEMALRESGPDGLPQWEDESVQFLQLDRLDLVLEGADYVRIVTYQNNDRFGLSCQNELPPMNETPPLPEFNSELMEASIFRTREFNAIPTGRIQNVHVVMDDCEDISEVHFWISGHCVVLRAGEFHESNDGTLTLVGMDESILFQVNGRKPDPHGSS